MTLAQDNMTTSRQLIEHAEEELRNGEPLQASEKAWGSVVHRLKAVARQRDWPHGGHYQLYQMTDRLVEETGDNDFDRFFKVAEALHANFYNNFMTDTAVRTGIRGREAVAGQAERHLRERELTGKQVAIHGDEQMTTPIQTESSPGIDTQTQDGAAALDPARRWAPWSSPTPAAWTAHSSPLRPTTRSARRALAVTANSPSLAPSELREAVELAERLGLNHRVIHTREVEREDYQANNPNRCFFCKDELYTHLSRFAPEEGYDWLANGTNVDDLGDFRPGLNAAKQYGVRSPLVEAELTKSEIRELSRGMDLPTWDKPAQACLSSRIPYGTMVTVEALTRIAQAEEFLHDLGIRQLRVRHHDNVARIEVEAEDLLTLVDESVRQRVVDRFREIGYSYVTVDLQGFRSGSMNEVLAGLRRKKASETK